MEGHIAVGGLGFGDESKGATVDWLCRREGDRPVSVVRLGGHQAGHNVVEPGGRHHCFAQFGSGTLAGVPTFLSRYMTFEPLALTAEADHLIDIGVKRPYDTLTVDGSCLVVTPFHIRGNHLNAANLGHGTCGKGHGEAIRLSIEHPEEVLRVRDLESPVLTRQILRLQDARFRREYPEGETESVHAIAIAYDQIMKLVRVVDSNFLAHLMTLGNVVFELSQGVLLDQDYGFHPHTTWSTTTFANVDRLVADAAPGTKVYRLGCLRSYTTRHGAGPFPTEDPTMAFPEPHNGGGMQGWFRQGVFDAVLHRYAIDACGRVDGIALSHLDLAEHCLMVTAYPGVGQHPYVIRSTSLSAQQNMGAALTMVRPVPLPIMPFPRAVEDALGVPVVLTAHGPTHQDRKRFWVDKKISKSGTSHP